MWTVRIIGILIFIAGGALAYYINRKRFNRRTITGMQMFNSFEHAWSSTYLEKFGKLIAYAAMIFGVFLFIASF